MTSVQFGLISKLWILRNVFSETLSLYPPVPMMVREASCPEQFRDREVKIGSRAVISPWHLHRHEYLWGNLEGFDPTRLVTENGRKCQCDAYIQFSAGSRVCTVADFAIVESVLTM